LRLIGGFRGQAIEWCQSNITTTDLGCHGNEIWDKIGYNSACIRDISSCLRPTGGFRVGLSNDVSQILQRPIRVTHGLVSMDHL